MKLVAYAELVIFLRVLLGAITFRNSLLSPILFAHFLRQRYYQSAFTRDAVADTVTRLDALVKRPGNPPVVGTVWEKAREIVRRWAGVVIVPNEGQQQ